MHSYVQQVAGQECGEHLVRIRILEQEAERHLRRVQNLEHQLADMEKKTQERVEQVPVQCSESRILGSKIKFANQF